MAAPPPAPTRAAWPTAGLFQRGQCTVGCVGECSHPATGLEQNLGELEFARSACSAAQAGDEAQLAKLLERSAGAAALRGDGAGGASGFTPLHYAARNGHAGCVALLLRHRAAVDAATSGGATALHRAAFCGHEAIVRALLGSKTYLEKAGLILSHPGAEAQRWHMDNPHLYAIPTHLPPHSLTVFVALCELTAANGPTEFHLATHVKAHLAAPRKRHAAARCAAGSLVVYDTRILHRGGANASGAERPLVYMTFSRVWFRDTVNP